MKIKHLLYVNVWASNAEWVIGKDNTGYRVHQN